MDKTTGDEIQLIADRMHDVARRLNRGECVAVQDYRRALLAVQGWQHPPNHSNRPEGSTDR